MTEKSKLKFKMSWKKMCLSLLILSTRPRIEELRNDLQRVFVCSQRHKQEYVRNTIFFSFTCAWLTLWLSTFLSFSHIINELIETERVYVEELQSIIEVRSSLEITFWCLTSKSSLQVHILHGLSTPTSCL